MNSISRRRFLRDLAAIGGFVGLVAGHGLEAQPVPNPKLKKKLNDAIDKAFPPPKEPAPKPTPPPVPHPHPGKVMPSPQPRPYPPSGAVAPRTPDR